MDKNMTKVHSKNYDNGSVWVACCECERGGNGNNPDLCSCGNTITEWDKMGCFDGQLIDGLVIIGPTLKWKGVQDDDAYKWHQENDKLYGCPECDGVGEVAYDGQTFLCDVCCNYNL